MNERIRELIKQATEHDYTTWDSYNQKELVYYKFNQEKFAELIVRECAELCLTYAEYEGPFQQMEFRKGQHFNTIIKHHFGVE